MKRIDTDAAFDLLLESLEKLTPRTDDAKRVARIIKRLQNLRKREWAPIRNRLMAKSGNARGKNLPAGARTPQKAFYLPLLKVLNAAGGSLKAAEAIRQTGTKIPLNDFDKEPLRSGEVRWKNTVRFARNELVILGLMEKGASGMWIITKAGQDYLKKQQLTQ